MVHLSVSQTFLVFVSEPAVSLQPVFTLSHLLSSPPQHFTACYNTCSQCGARLPVTLLGRGSRGGAVDNYAVRPGRAKCWLAVPGTWAGFSPTAEPSGSLALWVSHGPPDPAHGSCNPALICDDGKLLRPIFHQGRRFVR
jgi:hypothetical protein